MDFTLYIRDDGSEKEFVELLCGLQKKYDFKLLKEKNIGFLKSFMELLAAVDVRIYMLFQIRMIFGQNQNWK